MESKVIGIRFKVDYLEEKILKWAKKKGWDKSGLVRIATEKFIKELEYEEARKEMHKIIEETGVSSKESLKVSQELDKIQNQL